MSVFMTSEVHDELKALSKFQSKLQLDKLFDWFWTSADSVIAEVYIDFIILIPPRCFVNDQGLYWGLFVYTHDLTVAATRGGMRPVWLSNRRIRSHI